MRIALWIAVVAGLASPAIADTFNGFSGVDRPYLINQDRVCTPLAVANGAASGMPKCEKVGADVIARLSIKEPIVQRGQRAVFTAAASGQTITVSRKSGEEIVHWDAPDPVGKVVEVFATGYDDRVAVAYAVRRAGRDLVDVVAFDLIGQHGTTPTTGTPTTGTPTTGTPTTGTPTTGTPTTGTPTTGTKPVEDPKLAAAVKAARGAAKGKALDAWKAVLAVDTAHSEALFQLAAAYAGLKRTQDTLDTLAILAASQRPDAIDWLVEARFDAAFAGLRGDPKFRGFVGLDRKAQTAYERFMGLGGQWEQTGTSCDTPEVRLVAKRDRTFKLNVKTACHGNTADLPFSGTWRIDADQVVLVLPTHGKATKADEAPCKFETARDEDALHCLLGHDIDFVVLPTRR